MDHLIPTLLGIAGALAPVAFGFWIQQRRARAAEGPGSSPPLSSVRRVVMDEAIVRGGRIYL